MILEDKVAIITGGGKGMGRAICRRFAQEGAKIVIADVDEAAGKKVMSELKERGTLCVFVRTDVSKRSDAENMVKVTLKEFGRIDILINNAGVISISPVVDLDEKEWDRNMEVNAKGVFLCAQAVAKQMIKQGTRGKIVNTGSRLGKVGVPRYGHYCASKAAAINFTQTLALELAPYKINVNAVAPGIVYTDMMEWEWEFDQKARGMSRKELEEEAIATIPLGRIATPEDVAGVVLFLASKDADYMTGQAINVTGGMEFR